MCGWSSLASDAGLGQVRLDVLRAGDPLGVGDLDRDRAVELVVVGEVDPPESPLAQPPDHPVAADRAAIAERRSLGFGGRGRDDPRGRRTSPPTGFTRAPGPPIRPAVPVGPGGRRRPHSPRCPVRPPPASGPRIAADLINAAGHFDVQAAEVVAGSVAHLDSVLGPRFIDYSPPEPTCRGQTTKTHFEENVRFACDCKIMRDWGVRGSEAIDRFPGPYRAIDDDRALARRQDRCRSTSGGFDFVR